MSDYVTSTALKKTLSLTGESYADDDVSVAITAASRGIEEACGRRFWKDTNDVARYYGRTSPGLVVIDDLASLTTLKIDTDGSGTFSETWTLHTDFELEPINAAADSKPYTQILSLYTGCDVLPPGYLPSGRYSLPVGPRRIEVTGKFGWPSVPGQIVVATSKLAARLLKGMREAPLGIAGFGMDGAAIRIAKTDPDIGFLLEGLRRGKVGDNGIGMV